MRIGYKNKIQAYRAGLAAEAIAEIYFRFHGFRVLARRYKTKTGEIDLILRRGKKIVFVEVKARKTLAEAKEAISYKNRRRIENAARSYIAENRGYTDFEMRFDVLGVVLFSGFFPRKIEHLDNAWMSGA